MPSNRTAIPIAFLHIIVVNNMFMYSRPFTCGGLQGVDIRNTGGEKKYV